MLKLSLFYMKSALNCCCQYLNPSSMSEQVQDINPLDISFSNDKGFEPSTPSQGTPPQKPQECSDLRVTTPNELFTSQRRRFNYNVQISSFSIDTPSRHAPKISQSLKKYVDSPGTSYLNKYESKASSARKSLHQDHFFAQRILLAPRNYQSTTYAYGRDKLQPKNRPQVVKWGRVDTTNHLKEISRLNDLIYRINTHVTVFDKLYPNKRK